MRKKTFAVILAGCGHQDGSEIHEATLTLWAIHKHGGEFQCYAPDIKQHHVLNHINGQEMNDQRNVLIESAGAEHRQHPPALVAPRFVHYSWWHSNGCPGLDDYRFVVEREPHVAFQDVKHLSHLFVEVASEVETRL